MSAEHQHVLNALHAFRGRAVELRERISCLPSEPPRAPGAPGLTPAPAVDLGGEIHDAINAIMEKIGIYEIYLKTRVAG